LTNSYRMFEVNPVTVYNQCLMATVRFTKHALIQCVERGATHEEVCEAIRIGVYEDTKNNRKICKANFNYNSTWHDHYYSIKQVAPVIVEEKDEIVVVTVYTYYF